MNLNISAFTHAGTDKNVNQDNILVNGQILNAGEINFEHQEHCFCFVADGVGGNRAGDFASRYVLGEISKLLNLGHANLETKLCDVNHQLITKSNSKEELRGTATTLTGLVAEENNFHILHVGDSQMWLRRNGTLFKVTNDQVLDEQETNSPLISYFGGSENNLRFDKDIFVQDIGVEDVFLICSDGIFKSLNHKAVKAILEGEDTLQSQARALLGECLQRGADDNVSAILVQRTK